MSPQPDLPKRVGTAGCAIGLRVALELGVQVPLDEIPANEFYAMLMLGEEWERFERMQVSRRTHLSVRSVFFGVRLSCIGLGSA
ncbi:MAG: hypothetical protein ABFD89_26830 [Bryobacteraceae bacterium]